MNLAGLAGRGLRYHRKAVTGVFVGVMLATAVVAGALLVGESVRESLRRIAQARIGKIDAAWVSPERFFRSELAGNVEAETGRTTASLLLLRGSALGRKAGGDGDGLRVGRVQVLGVDDPFWKLSPSGNRPERLGADDIAIGKALARALGVGEGDEIVLRIEKPSLLSRDAPLSKIDDASVALDARIGRVLDDAEFGRFNLSANQSAPFNCFVPRKLLQQTVGIADTSNLLLVGSGESQQDQGLANVNQALWKHWKLEDAALELRRTAQFVELRTGRVFLEPAVARLLDGIDSDPQQILTYFVNRIEHNGRSTPYSTVSAMATPPGPPDLRDDEIVVNTWLADDLGAKVGDTIQLAYWVVGPLRKLEEQQATFRIRAIVPVSGAAADPSLMPDIPGLSDKKDCREWEPGVPIDLDKIRDKDQAWWTAHRGTPKAFLTLDAGRKIWKNRFGDLTAVRWTAPNPTRAATVEAGVRRAVNAASLGVLVVPVASQAAAATDSSFDFGQLFLGLSLFLIVSALVLSGLNFAFLAERRATEAGTLKALGWQDRAVFALFLREALLIVLAGSVAGMAVSFAYARLVMDGLGGAWSGAVAGTDVQLHAAWMPVLTGGIAGSVLGLASFSGVLRHLLRAPARRLLSGETEPSIRPGFRRREGLIALVCGVAGSVWAVAAGRFPVAGGAGGFFGAGSLLLIAGITAIRWALGTPESGKLPTRLSNEGLAVRFARRRRGRSTAVALLFATGTFLVVAVGANRPDTKRDGLRRDSGTGGFAWWMETSLPVFVDLNSAEGRETFGFDDARLRGVSVVPLRVREGDDASCLNLNRAQNPTLYGVDPSALSERGAFFRSGRDNPWKQLGSDDKTVGVVGDTNTVVWSLGKKLGDTLSVRDDNGVARSLRIVGILPNSILQGGLLMDEADFVRLFPRRAGYQAFLVDSPTENVRAVGEELSTGLEDVGVGVELATDRLSAFQAVEETYLAIFGLLGGLGLLLGTGGLAVLILRNVQDRRMELAVLRAVGLPRNTLVGLVVREHCLLLVSGVAVGLVSALVAVAPVVARNDQTVSWTALMAPLGAVLGVGLLAAVFATRAAMGGRMVDALRND